MDVRIIWPFNVIIIKRLIQEAILRQFSEMFFLVIKKFVTRSQCAVDVLVKIADGERWE